MIDLDVEANIQSVAFSDDNWKLGHHVDINTSSPYLQDEQEKEVCVGYFLELLKQVDG